MVTEPLDFRDPPFLARWSKTAARRVPELPPARAARARELAIAHGYAYVEDGAFRFPGFGFGSDEADRAIVGRVRTSSGREIEAGNIRFIDRRSSANGDARSGEVTVDHRTYVAVLLDIRLPHFVLDSTADNGLFRTVPFFMSGQRLALEGDFDRSFHLYAPSGYERDALYVFTPDLMAVLVDEAPRYDIEIIDDWLLLYARGRVDFDSPEVWADLERLTSTVVAKTIERCRRYADERVGEHDGDGPAPSRRPIGPGGGRLRQVRLTDGMKVALFFVALAATVVVSGFVDGGWGR